MKLTDKEKEILQHLLTAEQIRMNDYTKNSNGIEYNLDDLDELYFKLMTP